MIFVKLFWLEGGNKYELWVGFFSGRLREMYECLEK